MSEYNFEYKCVSSAKGVDAKNDKALQFMVYQDYKENGKILLQVYIPENLREKVAFIKLYFDDYAVDFPKITGNKDKDRELWKKAQTFNSLKSGKLSTLNEENCIYINPKIEMTNKKRNSKKSSSGCLSGTGLIGFILKDDPDGENGVPSVENIYKFVTNFGRKESISYQIFEHKHRIVVEVTYPKLSKDIRLNIIGANGHKPLTNGDRLNGEYIKDENNQNYVITLKKTKRLNDSVSVSISTDKASSYDFRLVFEDILNNNLYWLCDESAYTLEDIKVIRKENKNRNKQVKQKKVIRCPFCGEIIKQYEGRGGKQGIYTCSGEQISKTAPNGQKKMIVCNRANNKFGLTSSDEYMILPKGYGEKPVLNVAFAGKRKSGKTIFISSLVNIQKQPGDETIYAASPFVLNSIVNSFDKKSAKNNLGAKELKILTLVRKDDNSFEITKKYLNFRARQELDSRYVMTVGQKVERQTNAAKREELSYNPVGFDMRNLGFVYFYDVPGENFKETSTDKVRAFDIANGIVLIIDGNDENFENPFSKCCEALNNLKHLTTNSISLKNVPIAIVFSKLDLKLSSFYDENNLSELEQYKRCFDDNCHLVRENVLDIFPANGKYHNSELEKHIDCSSYEIEHYLKSLDKENGEKIANIKENFNNIKFFACSALGSNNVLLNDEDQKAKILFKPKRLRLELPIIWLMYKQGLIRK